MDAPPAHQFSIRELDWIEDGRRNRLCHRSTSRRVASLSIGTSSGTRAVLLVRAVPAAAVFGTGTLDPSCLPTRRSLVHGLAGDPGHLADANLMTAGAGHPTASCPVSEIEGRRPARVGPAANRRS
jgi:hypothetical protein